MTEYGFVENFDFVVLDKIVHDETAFGGNRKITDHALKIDMAKEISMIERIDKACIFLRKPHLCVKMLLRFVFT
ncbi:antA/AntB antirepressor family protein [Lysinibacillus sp. 1P01SD]|uniref:antA/AntB antirepressor family protein n=1 Tax=Lysinibacillus sp. 1P01SD TaxID=3132285 RepID=UPI0039A156B4